MDTYTAAMFRLVTQMNAEELSFVVLSGAVGPEGITLAAGADNLEGEARKRILDGPHAAEFALRGDLTGEEIEELTQHADENLAEENKGRRPARQRSGETIEKDLEENWQDQGAMLRIVGKTGGITKVKTTQGKARLIAGIAKNYPSLGPTLGGRRLAWLIKNSDEETRRLAKELIKQAAGEQPLGVSNWGAALIGDLLKDPPKDYGPQVAALAAVVGIRTDPQMLADELEAFLFRNYNEEIAEALRSELTGLEEAVRLQRTEGRPSSRREGLPPLVANFLNRSFLW